MSTLLLIDGHALIYRAYHAFRELSTPDGQLVNAVYGFSKILLTVIADFQPEYIAVAFDSAVPTFRHREFLEYKANREEMPADLQPQIEIIKRVVTAMNIPQFALPGYEADDLIGTLATQASELPVKNRPLTVIVTGDRDAFQLVNHQIHVWIPGRAKPVKTPDREYDEAGVIAKTGVKPSQIIDLKALMGDQSDNIPGVPGVGEVTAVKLLTAFDSVDNLYNQLQAAASGAVEPTYQTAVATLLKGKLVEKLAVGHQSALMSQKLATIDRQVPINLDLEQCRVVTYDKREVVSLFQELSFRSLLTLLPADKFEQDVQAALFT